MPSDRLLSLEVSRRNGTSGLFWLMSATVAAFLVQIIGTLGWPRAGFDLDGHVALSAASIQRFEIWTLASYAFLHSTGNLLHIIMVISGLALLGRALIPTVTPARFVVVYFWAVITGGLAWSAFNWNHGGMLIGGMAGIYGLFAFYACTKPDTELDFLLFFFFPVSFKPKQVVWGLAAADLLACGYYEVYRAEAPFAYAPSAHLGGLIAGFLAYRYLHAEKARSLASGPDVSRRKAVNERERPAPQPTNLSGDRRELRAELDRILDKINRTGLASLTPAERHSLDAARTLLTRN